MEIRETKQNDRQAEAAIIKPEGKKDVKRKRRKPLKENSPLLLVDDDKSAQTPAKSNDTVEKKRRRRSANQRRVFEVDNSELPMGIPPVKPFLQAETRGNSFSYESISLDSIPLEALPPEGAPPKGAPPKGAPPKGASPEGAPPENLSQASANMPSRRQKKVSRASLMKDEEIQEKVLTALQENGLPMAREALIDHTGAPTINTESVLLNMLERGQLFLTRKRKYALPEQLGYINGKLQTTTKGFGFLLPDNESEDVFISQNHMNGALHGDSVVVHLLEGRGTSREGEIVAVRSRANLSLVGTLKKDKSHYFIVPDNGRLYGSFEVEKGKMSGAKEGQKVVAEIVYGENEPTTRIKEVLGFPDENGTDVRAIVRSHNIPEEFPRHVQSAARAIAQVIDEDDIARREDLRALQTVTIDGADSKDFDDAVSCEKLHNGNYLLGVHIADVSQYVKENSALDKEAFRRATSVYLVDRVIPMLPEELSNGICSLNPDADRLTLSCFMEIDQRGRIASHRIAETVIRSHARLIYEDVTALLEGDKALHDRYEAFLPMLTGMEELAAILRDRREKRGSIDFDLPESKICADENGRTTSVGLYERGISNKIIEEFMLACNETVAEYMSYLERPMLYRVHEVPDDDRISELNAFLGGFGLALRGAQQGIRPKSLQTILEKAKGRPGEAVISRVVLRSLKKARYADENLGHFGLAADFYCHFTSPIRRYPDLEVHRIVKEMLRGQLTDKRQAALKAKLPEIAQHSSERERAAMEAERDVDDLKKCEYMAEHIGEFFSGVISGVTNFGIFVELPNTCEGLARLADIGDDYYEYDQKNYRVIGRHTHKIYRLGDVVTVQVAAADITARRVEFKIQQDDGPSGRRPRKPRT